MDCNQLADLVEEVDMDMDRGELEDQIHKESQKRRRSDSRDTSAWKSKKSKVSLLMRTIVSLTKFIIFDRRECHSVSNFVLGRSGRK